MTAGQQQSPPQPYRRAGSSRRGEERRRELLSRVTEDLAVNGLVGFSLRRAARAAGTTHKVLLYYFASAEDLLGQAVLQLRERRLTDGLGAAREGAGRPATSPSCGIRARIRRVSRIASAVRS